MTSPEDLVLIGAGGHAKVVAAAAMAGGHRIVAVFDDDATRWGGELLGAPIAGPLAEAGVRGVRAILGIGSNAARARLQETLALAWATVVHPSAWVHDSVRIGPGTVVCAGAVLQPDVVLGAHAIVNTAASVDHDSVIADYVHLAPGVRLAGGVRVGERSFLGVGACAIPYVTIGREVTVGAGGVVIRDLPDGVTAVGVPAAPRRRVT